jgi:hypothetical protein
MKGSHENDISEMERQWPAFSFAISLKEKDERRIHRGEARSETGVGKL